jgi:hypothetical protein
MEGEPTTLAAGLKRYVSELEGRDELQPRDRIVSELDSLLAYPWPGADPGPGADSELWDALRAYVGELEDAVALAPGNPEARAVTEILGRLGGMLRPA